MSTTTPALRVTSANLNGIRSASSKGFFDWLQTHAADVICVQELKAQAADMTAAMLAPEGYIGHFHYAEKKGYSGVGIYSRFPIADDTRIPGYALAMVKTTLAIATAIPGRRTAAMVESP